MWAWCLSPFSGKRQETMQIVISTLMQSHGQEKMKGPGYPLKKPDQQKLLWLPSRVPTKVCQLYPEGLASRPRADGLISILPLTALERHKGVIKKRGVSLLHFLTLPLPLGGVWSLSHGLRWPRFKLVIINVTLWSPSYWAALCVLLCWLVRGICCHWWPSASHHGPLIESGLIRRWRTFEGRGSAGK